MDGSETEEQAFWKVFEVMFPEKIPNGFNIDWLHFRKIMKSYGYIPILNKLDGTQEEHNKYWNYKYGKEAKERLGIACRNSESSREKKSKRHKPIMAAPDHEAPTTSEAVLPLYPKPLSSVERITFAPILAAHERSTSASTLAETDNPEAADPKLRYFSTPQQIEAEINLLRSFGVGFTDSPI